MLLSPLTIFDCIEREAPITNSLHLAKILVATDGSEYSDYSLNVATKIGWKIFFENRSDLRETAAGERALLDPSHRSGDWRDFSDYPISREIIPE